MPVQRKPDSPCRSVDMLGYVARHFEALSALIIVAYRPEELLVQKHPFLSTKHDLQGRGFCREIVLGFLTRDHIEEYVALRFRQHRFPRSLIDLVHAKTEGNPLFVINLLGYLCDQHVLSLEEGNGRSADPFPTLLVNYRSLCVASFSERSSFWAKPIWEPELLRVKGELLFLRENGSARAEAEACLTRALAVSKEHQAKSLELRAATSLARLWRTQARTNEAISVLSEVYSWFTEGLDTADLKEAHRVLSEIQG
jgi:hypothetical protein